MAVVSNDHWTQKKWQEEVRKYLDSEKITMISPTPAPWPLLLDPLLKERPASGLAIHDLHLAATMLSNGVKKIYTFNTRHFARFSDIEAIVPPEPEPLPDAPSAEEPTV